VFVLLREISLRHWLRSRVRSLLVVLGIALGVGLYVATEAASDSMLLAFDTLVKRISGRADLSVRGTGLGVPGEVAAELAEVPGVAHAAASIEVSVQAPDLAESLLVLGIDLLGDLHFLPFALESSSGHALIDPLSFVNDPTALLVSKHFALRHGLHTGSHLRLLTSDGPRAFTVRGVLDDAGAAASFGGQVAVMFLDAAQIAFGRGTSVDRVDIAVAPHTPIDSVRKRIAARLGKQLHVEHPAQIGTRLKSLVGPLRAALWVSGFLALVVGGFLVYNAVAVALLQRRREVAIMRALGVTRASTIGLFVMEAALLALPGVGLGLWLGSELAKYTVAETLDSLNRMYAPVAPQTHALPLLLIAKAFCAGLLLATLSAFFPARRGASLEPASVLAGAAAVQKTETPVRAMLFGALCVAVLPWLPVFHRGKLGGVMQLVLILISTTLATPAFILILRAAIVRGVEAILGIPGRLGLDYVARTLGRSTVNVLALMVAVGMSVSVGGWLGSFERSLTKWARNVGSADLTVTRGSPVIDRQHLPLPPEASAQVQAVAGVSAIQRFRSIEQQVGTTTFQLVATDTDTFIEHSKRQGKGWEFVEGAPLRAGDLLQRPSIVVSENGARLLHLKAGDSLSLATPKGEVSFAVRAVVVDYTSELGTGYIDLRYFREFWSDSALDALFVYVADASQIERVAQRIRAAMGGGSSSGSALFVLKTSALEQHVVSMLHQTFSYSRAVETMTLIIALLGVIGTMLAAVLDRRRDVGTLRSIGATRAQVASAIVVEAGFLGVCAALAGIVVGMIECRVFFETLLLSQTGWHLDFVFPWASATRSAGFVIVTSALAGALPAWRATRGEIVASAVND
jgi:putative ABC transport system permease protein